MTARDKGRGGSGLCNIKHICKEEICDIHSRFSLHGNPVQITQALGIEGSVVQQEDVSKKGWTMFVKAKPNVSRYVNARNLKHLVETDGLTYAFGMCRVT